MKRLLTVMAIVAMGCGAATSSGDEPTCDDTEYREAHYEECVGEDKYAEHKSKSVALVRELREAEADPASTDDTLGCESLPVHVCTGGGQAKCEWAAHREQAGAKYSVVCVCLTDHEVNQAVGACNGI